MSHATLVPSTAPTRVDDLTFSIHTTPFDEDYLCLNAFGFGGAYNFVSI